MIRFIAADLRRLWLGSLVVVLLVTLASALGIAVTLSERALRLGSARAADRFDLVVGAAGSETQLVLSTVFLQPAPLTLLPGKVLADLASDPRVAFAAPVGFGDSFAGHPIVGTTAALIGGLGATLVEGALFDAESEAVVGSAVPLALGQSLKPMHGTAEEGGHVHGEMSYRVVGRLAPTGTPWDRAILVPIEAVWDVHGMGHVHGEEHATEGAQELDGDHDHVGGDAHDHDHDHAETLGGPWSAETPGVPAILVKPKTIADAYRLRGAYRTETTLAVFPAEVLTRLYATLGDAKSVLAAVAIGAQILVAAAIALVTVVHVAQRRRQIGALRALGAPRGAIFAIVWGEIFALVALGIALGFALGYGAALFLGDVFMRQNGVALPVEFAREDAVLAIMMLAFSALLAALPALLAYRQTAASALRG